MTISPPSTAGERGRLGGGVPTAIEAAKRRVVGGLSYVAGGDATAAAVRRQRSWTLQEPQIDRRKYQDNSDVNDQPNPELVPEEQDVHADHDGYHREHVKRGGYPVSHRFILVSTRPAGLSVQTAPHTSTVLSRGRGAGTRVRSAATRAPSGSNATREARPQGPRRPGSAVYICTAAGLRERPHRPLCEWVS